MRDGVLKVLGESCEEFLRTPQFMDAMKKTLNAALDLRNFQRSGMDALHEQFQTPDKEDIDGVLLAIRHVERRLLDRLEDMDGRLSLLDRRVKTMQPEENAKPEKASAKRPKPRRYQRTTVTKRSSKK